MSDMSSIILALTTMNDNVTAANHEQHCQFAFTNHIIDKNRSKSTGKRQVETDN